MSADRKLVIRVELYGLHPKVWRRIAISTRFNFHALHRVIQASFGWTDSHLHLFQFQGGLELSDQSFEPVDGALDEKMFPLGILKAGHRFIYRYDFGDNWIHGCVVEAEHDTSTNEHPFVCSGGRMASPPEDFGGLLRYQMFLSSYKLNPRSKDVRERLVWAKSVRRGVPFDPFHFCPYETWLRVLGQSPAIMYWTDIFSWVPIDGRP